VARYFMRAGRASISKPAMPAHDEPLNPIFTRICVLITPCTRTWCSYATFE
jgi:hypothetical protein